MTSAARLHEHICSAALSFLGAVSRACEDPIPGSFVTFSRSDQEKMCTYIKFHQGRPHGAPVGVGRSLRDLVR